MSHGTKVNQKPTELALNFLKIRASACSPRTPAVHLFPLFAYKAKEIVPVFE
jgi:hypothetical protein